MIYTMVYSAAVKHSHSNRRLIVSRVISVICADVRVARRDALTLSLSVPARESRRITVTVRPKIACVTCIELPALALGSERVW